MKKLDEFYIDRQYTRSSDKASCYGCDWCGSGHNKARQHCKETGHTVLLEANYKIIYKREPNKWLTDHEARYYKNSSRYGEKEEVCIICGYKH